MRWAQHERGGRGRRKVGGSREGRYGTKKVGVAGKLT